MSTHPTYENTLHLKTNCILVRFDARLQLSVTLV